MVVKDSGLFVSESTAALTSFVTMGKFLQLSGPLFTYL